MQWENYYGRKSVWSGNLVYACADRWRHSSAELLSQTQPVISICLWTVHICCVDPMSAHLYLVRVLCKVVVCMLSICKFHGMHIHVHCMHLSLVEDCVIPLFAADVLDEGCSCRVADMKSRLQCRQSDEMLPFWSLYNWRDHLCGVPYLSCWLHGQTMHTLAMSRTNH